MPHDGNNPVDTPQNSPTRAHARRRSTLSSALGSWPDPMDRQLSLMDGAALMDRIAARLAAGHEPAGAAEHLERAEAARPDESPGQTASE